MPRRRRNAVAAVARQLGRRVRQRRVSACRWNMSFSMSMPARHSDLLVSPIGERIPAGKSRASFAACSTAEPRGRRLRRRRRGRQRAKRRHSVQGGSIGCRGCRASLMEGARGAGDYGVQAPWSVDGMPSRDLRSCSADRPSTCCDTETPASALRLHATQRAGPEAGPDARQVWCVTGTAERLGSVAW